MRKSVLGLWGIALLAVLCASCAPAEGEAAENSYQLYFREADLTASAGGDVFRTETADLEEGLKTREAVEALVRELLAGPRSELLQGTLPAGTTLLSAQVEGSRALVDFSAAYSTLSGVRLTLADYAVTLTLTQLPEISSVKITVQGQELAYRDKQVFTLRDVLLSSEEDVVGTVEAALYFLSETGELTEEWRTLDLYEGDTQAAAVIRALEGPAMGKGLVTALPEGFRVRSVWQEEGVCYVNLSSTLLEGLDQPLGTALQAVSQALCSLDAVDEVRFLVDGEFENRYGDVDLSGPYDPGGPSGGTDASRAG